jgi:hypothetical protein
MKKIKLKLREKIKKIFNLYDINDLVIGGHCGCCGNYIPDEIFEKNFSWGICKKCREL